VLNRKKYVRIALDVAQDDVEPACTESKCVKIEDSTTTTTVHDSRSFRIELPEGSDTVVACKNGRETSINFTINVEE